MVKQIYAVLLGYPPTDFEQAKKPIGRRLEIENFFVVGG